MQPRYYLATLIGITFLCYAQIYRADFTNWDDGIYVQFNSNVWQHQWYRLATEYCMGNFHPLTMLSYGVEHFFFGMNPKIMHLTNLWLHLLNTVLVYVVCRRLAIVPMGAVFISALFALHPLHVESVAWISARKDVLYSCFFLSSFYFYGRFLIKKDHKLNYGLSMLLFLAALLSKPSAMTLPLCLVALHYYEKTTWKQLVYTLPFWTASLLFFAVTLNAQEAAVQDSGFRTASVTAKFLLGTSNIGVYIAQFFAPFRLSCLYPYPSLPLPSYYYLAPLLGAVGIFLLYRYRHQRLLVFGTLFFIINLLPVLQFMPVGYAAHADRYTYLPYIGLSILIYVLFYKKISLSPAVRLGGAMLWLFLLSILTFQRIKVWQNSETLWTDFLTLYPKAAVGHNNLAKAVYAKGNFKEAIVILDRALSLDSLMYESYNNRGAIYYRIGDTVAALRDYTTLIRQKPNFFQVHYNRGNLYLAQQQWEKAESDFDTELRLNPSYADAWYARAIARQALGRRGEAMEDVREAERLYELQENKQGLENCRQFKVLSQ